MHILIAKVADDHDTEWQSILVPFGILNTDNEQLSIYLGQSSETSDFIVDCLTAWWCDHQLNYSEPLKYRCDGWRDIA